MDMYDIRGAQDIIAQADLVLTLERKHTAAIRRTCSRLEAARRRQLDRQDQALVLPAVTTIADEPVRYRASLSTLRRIRERHSVSRTRMTKYRSKKRRDTDAYLPLANMLREVFEFIRA
jgi:hypothetical protein